MTALPANSSEPVDGVFIIVKDSQGKFRLGVPSVAPGAIISFLNAHNYEPSFQNGNSPFNAQTTTIAAGAGGTYPFNMVLKVNPTPVSNYPYSIHVVANGAGSAVLKVEDDDLRVVVSANRQSNGSLNIEFEKEGFQNLVELNYELNNQSLTATIPSNQPKGYWSLGSGSEKHITFTVKNQPAPFNILGGMHSQVVGGDAGDLDILPPEG